MYALDWLRSAQITNSGTLLSKRSTAQQVSRTSNLTGICISYRRHSLIMEPDAKTPNE